jgi:hypothetical protein
MRSRSDRDETRPRERRRGVGRPSPRAWTQSNRRRQTPIAADLTDAQTVEIPQSIVMASPRTTSPAAAKSSRPVRPSEPPPINRRPAEEESLRGLISLADDAAPLAR